MSQMIEFAGNHLLLFGGLLVVLFLIVKMELDGRMSGVSQLNPVQAVQLMNQGDFLLLDVREAQEYSSGHIPMSALKKRSSELEKHKDKSVLIYCRSGSRSNYACKVLRQAGFEKVNNMSGGVMSWSNANLPLTKK